TETFEGVRRETRVGAVRAIHGDAHPRKVCAEAFDNVIEVAVGRNVDVVDRAAARGLRVEELLDALLLLVAQLATVAAEELDAVVLRRIVRRRDDDTEIE